MGTNKRFVAKNGLDNNNQTLSNVTDPVNEQDAATKSFAKNVDNHVSGTTNKVFSSTDKTKLDGIAASANNYTHPTTDGSHHVPATGTTNNTKVLKAGATAGSEAWAAVDYSELTSKPTLGTSSSKDVAAAGNAAAAQVVLGNDTRLTDSRTPISHSHLTADLQDVLATTLPVAAGTASAGASTKASKADHVHPVQTTVSGNAGTSTKLATARNINGVAFDGSADITVNAVDSTARIASTEKGVVNGVATLGADGKVPSTQLPSFVDDVLEYTNLAAFPVTGETAKIYVALDTNKTYRWSGSAYIYITSGAVDSVAGRSGVVTLTNTDVGLGNVTNVAQLANSQTLAVTGDVTATATALNSGTIATTLVNSGVTAGTYKSVTTDAKGRVTAGTNPTTLAGYGISDAAPSSHVGATGAAHGNVVAAGASGFMTGADKTKLDGIAASANNYSLPIATAAVLGGVKDGTGVTIDGTGLVSVDYGSSAGTAVQGNDTRVVADQAAVTASIRTLGTGALQAAAGDHGHTYASLSSKPNTVQGFGMNAEEMPAGIDLDTKVTYGVFSQSATVEATLLLHYPIELAGLLEVFSYGSMIHQRYWVYNSSDVYSRAKYTTGAWTTWKKAANIDNTVASADKLTTGRNIQLTGDVTGTVVFDGTANAIISTTIAADSVALGTDTTGNFVSSVATTAPLSGGAVGSEATAITLALASAYGDTQNPYGSKTAKYILAAPNGVAGVPSFRALVASDIPTLNQSTTGSAATLTTARTLTVGNTGKTFDGSTNVGFSLAEIGASASGHNHLLTIGNGTTAQIALGTEERLDLVAGTNVSLAYDDATNKVTISTTGTLTGNADTATKLATARTISLSGDATGSVSFDGSANATIITTVADNSHSHTSANISDATDLNTVSTIVKRDASGNFRAGTVTAALTGNASTATALQTGRTIALTGDVTYTSPTFNGSGNVTAAATLANSGVAAGTYNNSATAVKPISVDAKGRVTSVGTDVTITPAFASITGKPTTVSGYGISDAYTKTEIDSQLQGLKAKASVKVASTANIALNTATTVIDGITIAATDRVLLKDQTTGAQNGVYTNITTAAWTRTTDADTTAELTAAYIFVEQGTTNQDTAWVQTADAITVGTTALTWVKFAGSGAYASTSHNHNGTYVAGNYTAGNASGNVPVSNSTLNVNLNADMLDGCHVGTSGSVIPKLDGNNTWSGTQIFSGSSSLFKATTSTEGGEFILEKPSSSTLAGSVYVDINGDTFRIFEGAGTFRGIQLNLANLPAGQHTLWTSGNDGPGSGLAADTASKVTLNAAEW